MGDRYWVWLAARLVFAVVIVAWAFSYLTPGGSGEKEFRKTLEAMKQVHSVRLATIADPTPTQHSEISQELVCSQNALHFKWHMVESDPERAAEVNDDNLQVGYVSYIHKPDGSWEKNRFGGGGGNPSATCKRLAQGDNSDILPDIATMIKRGILEKGDKKTVSGVRCREWKVTMRGGYSGLEHLTLCLGVNDHLPYEMAVDWQRSHTVYSDYNAPFQLELPEAALQPASADSGTN